MVSPLLPLLLSLATAVRAQSQSGQCPAGWSQHGNGCYQVVFRQMAYSVAKQTCTSLDAAAFPASIVDEAENKFVAELLNPHFEQGHRQFPNLGNPLFYGFWIGLHRVINGARNGYQCSWEDGSSVFYGGCNTQITPRSVVGVAPWAQSQPSGTCAYNEPGPFEGFACPAEGCATMVNAPNGEWNDVGCETPQILGVVCKKTVAPAPTPAPAPAPVAAPAPAPAAPTDEEPIQ